MLLAEDNDLNAELATILLEDSEMIVTRAADGQEVVDLLPITRRVPMILS